MFWRSRSLAECNLSLTRFGGQVVKPLVPSVRFLFFPVVVVSCGNCGTEVP